MIGTKPFSPAQCQWLKSCPWMLRQWMRRKDTEVGRRNKEGERGREKEKRHSREQLDASHKRLTQIPHWDAGQRGCLSRKLMGQAGDS